MVPALPDAECPVAYKICRLKCPAPGTPAPHSTRRRAATFVRAVDEMLNLVTAPRLPLSETNPPRRGGPLRPPALENKTLGRFYGVWLAVTG